MTLGNVSTSLAIVLTIAVVLARPAYAQSEAKGLDSDPQVRAESDTENNVDNMQLAAKQLSKRLQVMNSLTASFQQRIHDADGEFLQEASGKVVVKRPRMFHWQTQQPYEHLLVTDGTTMWLYDVDLEQINRKPFSADLDKAPALLLSGELEEIQKHYHISTEQTDTASTAKQFTLTPLTTDSVFSNLTIIFSGDFIASMKLVDSFGQITTIQFSDVTLNPKVADSQFTFVPPAGIDVISDEP